MPRSVAPTGSEDTTALVARVLAGDRGAARRLAESLLPLVHGVVGRCLVRCRAPARGDAHQMSRDLVQQVFVALFENDMRVLRQWDPSRGRSLSSFVGLVSEREVWSVLRSGARSPFTEEPTDFDAGRDVTTARAKDAPIAGTGSLSPEDAAIRNQLVLTIVDEVRERLGERGVLLLQLLVVEERSAEEITAITGMTQDAIYAWHSRLRRLVRKSSLGETSGMEAPPRRAQEEAP